MIPQLKRLLGSDIPEAPAWMNTVLGTVNKFMQDTYSILKKQITFQDNIRCEIKELSLVAPIAISVPTSLANPIGVLLLSVEGTDFIVEPVLKWSNAQGAVKIDSISGLTSGKTYKVRILVI